MTDLIVKPVKTRGEKRQFLRFPWTLYQGDPNWIPPLRTLQKEMVGYHRHPFYERNEARTFIALRGGEVCGRVAAILNRGHNERFKEERGFFGFFDCRDDPEAAHGLFDAVKGWFAERGVFKLRGPANPSLNYEVGLLVDGFDAPPTFMMTYNPPYYGELIESYGFRKVQDMYAYWGHVRQLPQVAAKLGPIAAQIEERFGAKVRPMNRKKFYADVEAFVSIYNRSLGNTWGFVPMSPAELKHMARSLSLLVIPELALGIEIEGRMVGAVLCLPDYNPRIRQIGGRLFPFGFIRLLWNKQGIKKIRILSANVLPEYQLMGLGLVLVHALVPEVVKWGIQEAEFSWVLESNLLSRGSLEKAGAARQKTYRVYDLDT